MDTDFAQSLIALGGVPLLLAFTQLCKAFVSDTRYYPVISVCAGIVLNIMVAIIRSHTSTSDILMAIILGLIAGLAASGLYSGVSTYKEGSAANKGNRPAS